MDIISRDDARTKGLKRFFSGIPCRRGHVCERYVIDYSCIDCSTMPERQAKVKAYDIANRERRLDYYREYREDNREIVNWYGCEWARKNPEKHALQQRKRRVRQLAATGSHTVEQIFDLLAKQKGKCPYCKTSIKDGYEVDHIDPLSKGGSDAISNIQLLCTSCNRRKNAKDPFAYAQENGRLL